MKIDFKNYNITFNNSCITYDGTEKSIYVSGDLPNDINVTYEGNNKIDVGEYDVIAHFTSPNNKYINLNDMTATMTIEKADYDMSFVSFSDTYYDYDELEHNIELSYADNKTLSDEISVSYDGNGQKEIGEYDVIAHFTSSNNNYNDISDLSAKLVIGKGDNYHYVTFNISEDIVVKKLVKHGDSLTDIPGIFEKEGYFGSWNYDFSNVIEDVELTPVYTPNQYLIIYDENGGDKLEDRSQIVNYGEEYILSTPTREGYTFTGWFNGDILFENGIFNYTSPIKLVASWEANKYEIKYDVNGGTPLESNKQIVTYDTINELIQPTRLGYVFSGWYYNNELIDESQRWSIANNVILTAKWTKDTYNVVYRVNGGTPLVDNVQKVTYDEEYTLIIPERNGYVFAGWFDGDDYFQETGIWNKTNTVILTAVWIPNIYTITYDVNGGHDLDNINQLVSYDSQYILIVPTRTGYTFTGWYYNDELVEDGNWNYATSLVLRASWEANEYEITYDVNGGNPLASNTQKVVYDSQYTLVEPTRTGYTFTGWYYNDDLAESGIWTYAESISLIASWEANEYQILYDVNGGNPLASNTQKVVYDSQYTLVEPTRTGYTFTGWFYNEDLVETSIWTYAESVTFVASWEANEYQIIYDVNEGDPISNNPQNVLYDSEYTLIIPTRIGFTFDGWYYGEVLVENGIWTYTESITLVASWELTVYKIQIYDKHNLIQEVEANYGNIYSDLFTLPTNITPNFGYEFNGWYDQNNNEYSDSSIVTSDVVISTKYDVICYEVPVIEINTENYQDITSKEEYLKSTVTLLNTNEEYCFENVSADVRGRGNSTWGFPKKSYRIKFNKKQSMFGSSYKAKSWTLIANYTDKSLSRNYIAYELSKYFNGIDFTSVHEFVELFLNGEYKGVYLLCDQMQTGEGRVEIDEDLSDLNDIGFFIERDARAPSEGLLNQDYFKFRSQEYAIKTPDTESSVYLDNYEAYVGYISSYLNSSYQTILTGVWDNIIEYINIDSFIDSYIITELFANNDYGYSSTYYYRDKGGKLTAGPVWDFDIGAGNVNYNMGNSNECLPDSKLWVKLVSTWDSVLINNSPEFIQLLKEKLNQYHDLITSIISNLDTSNVNCIYNRYKSAFDRNFERWNIMGKYVWPEPESVYTLTTVEEQLEYLRTWLLTRLAYIEECYSVEVTDNSLDAYKVTFFEDNNSSVTIYNTNNYDEGIKSIVGWSNDGTTGELLKDGTGQINFKIELKDGYEVDSLIIDGLYNKLKTPVDTGVEGLYRITKINSDLTILIKTKVKEESTDDPDDPTPTVNGFNAVFNVEHATIIVYNTQDYNVDGTIATSAVSRNSSTGEPDESGDGQINFKLVLDSDYEIKSITIEPANYKNIKLVDADNNIYRITKITGDITINIIIE